jgi:hypothetical protein
LRSERLPSYAKQDLEVIPGLFLRVERSLSEILQIFSLTLFEKTPIFQALSVSKSQDPEPPYSNQLNLFDL